MADAPPAVIAAALRASLREGYSLREFKDDALAGVSVGVLAVPLAMALAIASGMPPERGLFTSVIAGAICALCGGSRLSVSGPTAAFVVLLAPVAHRYGAAGLLTASLFAGAVQIAMGSARLGALVQYIPYPVTTGFTAGIAIVIATLQLKDFAGLRVAAESEHFLEKASDLARAIPSARGADLATGVLTLLALIACARWIRRIPAPLIAIPAAAVAAYALHRFAPGCEPATIGSRFSYQDAAGATHAGVPSGLPAFVLPWALPGPDGRPLQFDFDLLRALVGPALTIAMLGAIESLLCAVVADGMAGTRHDPDGELVGQGLGNVVAPFFGGFAATGAIARTATSIRSGARSPVAALVHSLLVLAALLALGPALAWVPMAALAALLLIAAWNMSDVRHVARVLRVAPRADKAVLLACLALTVVFDMVIAVGVGVVLAALLFMRRMAAVSQARLLAPGHPERHARLPADVMVYEIRGPLFFGAAEKAVAVLRRVEHRCRAMILDLEDVPAMDVTGAIALQSAIGTLNQLGIDVAIAAAHEQPREVIARAVASDGLRFRTFATLDAAIAAVAPPA